MRLPQRIELVDDRVYRGNLALLALKLGPELRVLVETSSQTTVVIADVLLGLSLVERRSHEILGANCSTCGTSCTTYVATPLPRAQTSPLPGPIAAAPPANATDLRA